MTEKKEDKTGLPLKQEVFLEAGVHIGTKIRTNDMREFVFKRRDDGLFILDLRKTADRLLTAAKMLARYDPAEVTIVASRVYSSNPASKFATLTGMNLIKGRFVPGTMTNMTCKSFIEPRVLLVCDPKGEHEAIVEAAKNGVPIIAMCDTDNETKFIDYVIPINNKGKRSLALAFYILAREIMMAQGKISSYDEFGHDISYFEQFSLEEEESPAASAQQEKPAKAEEKPEKAPSKEKPKEKPKKSEEKAEAGAKEEKPEKKENAAAKEKEAAEEKPKKSEEEKPEKKDEKKE